MRSDPSPPGIRPPETWPAVSYETVPWVRAEPRVGTASRREALRHRGPYRAALVPLIADRTPWLPSDVAALAEDASTEIARFDSTMGAEIAPFAAVLLRSESAASSQIENLTASARAIAEAELGDSSRPNATEIVANVSAMRAAIELSDQLDAGAILTMHRALMESTHPAIAGQWRTSQVWIGRSRIGPHDADFVPPRSERVPEAIEDLLQFINREDVPVLTQAAIAHAQFETIHPFVDGNGRAGRALMQAMLRGKALTRNVTVPVSAGLLTDTDTYFAALTGYRLGDPTQIVRRLAEAAFDGVNNGRALVTELRTIRHDWSVRVKARRDSATWQVCDLLIRQPVVDTRLLAREIGITSNNAVRHLSVLEQAGVLVELTGRQRNRAWRAPEVLSALDAFAQRAGRRTS